MKKYILLSVFPIAFLFWSCEKTDGCPTTSACGCSSKSKADCQADICCAWTVGEGCDCN